jgi:hypothetical protein
MNKKYQKMASDLAKAGRGGDDQLLHVSKSELAGLGSLLPSGKLPINPETGQPEALIFTLPALLISMAIGAGTGAISGGVTAKEKGIPLWEGILTGAGTGAATGMVTAGIGGALAPAGTAAVDAGTKAATEGIAQGIAEGAGQASLDAAVDTSVDASLDAALDATLNQTLDTAVSETAQGGLDLASQNVLDQTTNALVSEAPGVAADVTTEVVAQTPDIAANVGQEVVQAAGENTVEATAQTVGETAVETLASETAEDIGTEVLVDSAEEGFFDGLKESALGLKEQAIEKLGPNNVEFLDWYTDSALAMTAPAAIVQATQRSEWDADDEHGYYNGPYDKSWESGPGVSWAAKDGGEVKRRSMKSADDTESLSRIKSLINMLQKTMDPTIPGKYNPLSDEDIRMKIRPNMPGGMQRVGVTLPFRQGGLASRNLRSGGLGSLRRP